MVNFPSPKPGASKHFEPGLLSQSFRASCVQVNLKPYFGFAVCSSMRFVLTTCGISLAGNTRKQKTGLYDYSPLNDKLSP